MNQENCILITNEKNWVEQAAKDQLCGVGRLPGVIKAVGLPDLHPGKTPVGMAVLSQGRFYPHLIGNDIGCGMSLFKTEVKQKKFKMDKWVTRLNSIRGLEDIPCDIPYDEACPIRDFGTIGAGNHFAEFQCLYQVYDEDTAGGLGLLDGRIFLLIHSGSRGYGQDILSRFYSPAGLEGGSQEAGAYLAEHDNALLWAGRNRLAAAVKLLDYLNVDSQVGLLTDSCHNYVEQTREGWLHRKGSVSAGHQALVIPGSRGTLTYVCVPGRDTHISLDSISHGAGRKWARSICKSRIDRKYDRNSIRSTRYKSQVVCHDTNLLFAEAPEAYKNVEQVMEALQEYGLVDVIATLRPLITFKG
ncbi:RNA ligase RtcB family protein [Enterocloster aldenensis]|uniref:RNA ligase RtcB family protein n=1 Tax=Enterocloster aldenensis TaxID=358742 RepID=UPI001D09809E|nr:RNA ligase RtcB family protein [Enterocloster aldenensis]